MLDVMVVNGCWESKLAQRIRSKVSWQAGLGRRSFSLPLPHNPAIDSMGPNEFFGAMRDFCLAEFCSRFASLLDERLGSGVVYFPLLILSPPFF